MEGCPKILQAAAEKLVEIHKTGCRGKQRALLLRQQGGGYG